MRRDSLKNFLKVHKTKIVDAALLPVHLRGLNLGGWLMMEAYFMHAPNRAEQLFKKKFAAELGRPRWKNLKQISAPLLFRKKILPRLPNGDLTACGFLLIFVSLNPLRINIVKPGWRILIKSLSGRRNIKFGLSSIFMPRREPRIMIGIRIV